jgi:hypothetical protein
MFYQFPRYFWFQFQLSAVKKSKVNPVALYYTYISQIYLKSQFRIIVVIFILFVHNMFRPLRAILK